MIAGETVFPAPLIAEKIQPQMGGSYSLAFVILFGLRPVCYRAVAVLQEVEKRRDFCSSRHWRFKSMDYAGLGKADSGATSRTRFTANRATNFQRQVFSALQSGDVFLRVGNTASRLADEHTANRLCFLR